jgi:hypothetical protein
MKQMDEWSIWQPYGVTVNVMVFLPSDLQEVLGEEFQRLSPSTPSRIRIEVFLPA